nr:hypothetical protein [Pseudomonadota bacterium]
PPASFILAQGENAKIAFEQLLVTEVFKRATKGYHHTKNTFFYYYIIVKDRLFIAPELLFPSLMFASYCCVRKYDRKYFFLLLWTILPIVGQSLAKSKLEWYILPALPAASILSGLMLGKLWEQVLKGLQRYLSNKQSMDLRATLSSLALLFFLSSIAISICSVADIFLNQQNRNDADLITSDLLDYQKVSGKQFQLIFYNQPKLAAHELFYFNLLNYKSINNMKNLQDEILNADMIITNTSEIAEIAKLRPFTSYTILKGRDLRYRKLVIISYIQEIVPRPLRQVFKTVDFNDDVNVRAYGFKNPVFLPSKEKVYPSVGERSAMLIDTDKFYNLLNTELRINLASLSPEQNGKLKVGIYINETKITDIENILNGLHWYSLQVPAGVWQEGINTLTLKYELPNSEQIDSTIQLALFNQLEIALKQE